jgi:hypothetical protein
MNITLPLYYLHELFTGDSPPKLAGVKPLSLAPHVREDVFIIRWELGALISKLDPQEEFFHVEMYPSIDDQQLNNTPTSHAELYTTFVWQNSAAKVHTARTKLRRDNEPIRVHSTARRKAYQDMVKYLSTQHIPAGNAATVAEIITQQYSPNAPENVFVLRLAEAYKVKHILDVLHEEILQSTNPQ